MTIERGFVRPASASADYRSCDRWSRFSFRVVITLIAALLFSARPSFADVTITFTGFDDAQLLSVYQSQGWDVGSEAWYMGGAGGPYYSAYEFRTIAAGDPLYTGEDAIYAPFGQAWFVQMQSGLSFNPNGDSITIAGLGKGGPTSFDIVGFSGTSEVLEETISTALAFPDYTTIRVSDPSFTTVTQLEFAPSRPLDYQIISLDVGTISPAQTVPEPSSALAWATVIVLASGTHAIRRRAQRRVRDVNSPNGSSDFVGT